jgi:glycosyltransferase involved in cell wall biosynthesis
MNIVVIHEVGYLSKPVYEYQDFAERLAHLGHSVTVINFDESCVTPFEIKKVTKTGLASITLVTLPNIGIPIIKILYARYRFRVEFKRIVKKNNIDAVFLYSVFVNGIDAVKICRQSNIRIVFRAIDAYHTLRKNPWQSWLLKQGESFIYRNVSLIAVTNQYMDRYVRQIAGLSCAKTLLLDHGVDITHFHQLSFDDVLAKALGITKSDLVAVFLGTTYEFSQIDKVVENIPEITKHIPNFKVLIIGAGELDLIVADKVDTLELEGRVIFCGMIDYSLLPKYLSLAQLAILPFKINEITENIIPIKMLQYLSSSLPVVSTPLPDVVNHFPEVVSGVVYSHDDEISSFLLKLQDVIFDRNFEDLSNNARQFVSVNYSIDAATINLEKILLDAVGAIEMPI